MTSCTNQNPAKASGLPARRANRNHEPKALFSKTHTHTDRTDTQTHTQLCACSLHCSYRIMSEFHIDMLSLKSTFFLTVNLPTPLEPRSTHVHILTAELSNPEIVSPVKRDVKSRRARHTLRVWYPCENETSDPHRRRPLNETHTLRLRGSPERASEREMETRGEESADAVYS